MTEVPKIDRTPYLEAWAKQLGVDTAQPGYIWKVVEILVNEKKNYESAVSLMFDLSYKYDDQKQYLRRATDGLKQMIKTYPVQPGQIYTSAYLYKWTVWYATSVEVPPK